MPSDIEELTPARPGHLLLALALACHPLPAAAVTVFISALAASAGRDSAGVALVAGAVLTGQLSIGWSNDARDEDRDRRADRWDKPTVRGEVSGLLLWQFALAALVGSVALSYICAGPIGGSAHVLAVLSAWAYNLMLKTTVYSALPYALSFGLVPAFVTYGLTPPAPPSAWAAAACALLGVGAHLANAIPDVERDESVAAGGLAAAVGVRCATVASLTCLIAALALVVVNLGVSVSASVTILSLAVAGAVAVGVGGRGKALFGYALALAATAVALLLVAGGSIVR